MCDVNAIAIEKYYSIFFSALCVYVCDVCVCSMSESRFVSARQKWMDQCECVFFLIRPYKSLKHSFA